MVKLESLKKATNSEKSLKKKDTLDYFSIFAAKNFLRQNVKIIYLLVLL